MKEGFSVPKLKMHVRDSLASSKILLYSHGQNKMQSQNKHCLGKSIHHIFIYLFTYTTTAVILYKNKNQVRGVEYKFLRQYQNIETPFRILKL